LSKSVVLVVRTFLNLHRSGFHYFLLRGWVSVMGVTDVCDVISIVIMTGF
jgi:hypothetical protein